ncbi:transglutaminase-like putative cysteine protease [Novosphingobium kunmingense]|uniref:Transglutaminase-like putative cysteine protease n=1 Tax=Novosphingobium kunmingense TaxID=1211806 RepID=A0A2N0H6A3_9SPHN|nr:transglutaminase family protein [Novosphingobium kunmingense]PKB14473.1 transglutaminase-like putative cysteine protease [Novosphingobium kunmingense]
MNLSIHSRLVYDYFQATDVLVQVEAAHLPDQTIDQPELWLTPVTHFVRVPGHDELGERIWLRVEGRMELDYRAKVMVDRPAVDIAYLPATDPRWLPGEVIDYLMPSRFCPSDRFFEFVSGEFGGLRGGACVAALTEWVSERMTYVPGASHSGTCATDTFIARQGVCRDYAHLLIALVRAASIPARYASVYAPDVDPPDFHAVAEVFLDGAWHLVDATGMAGAADIARIGVGRDAADTSFLSSFGQAALVEQFVTVERVS